MSRAMQILRHPAPTMGLGVASLAIPVVAAQLLLGRLAGGGPPGLAASALLAAIGVAAYLLNSLGNSVGALRPYRKLSPFYWYIDNQPLLHGFDLLHVVALLGVAAVLLAATVWTFGRRDVGV